MSEDLPNDALDPAAESADHAEQSTVANAKQSAASARRTPADPQPMPLPEFDRAAAAIAASKQSIQLLKDVGLHVKIELGRSRMLVEDVLRLGEGSVVELDKLAGDPVDVFVNERLVARGEVLVLNDNFCVRVNEIISDLAKGPEDED